MAKPIEYELDDANAKEPETEADALARLQREDECLARRMGLAKEQGAPAGKKWLDGIGGNSANAVAARLIEQEARLAERKKAASRAALRTLLVGSLLLCIALLATVAALDYTGLIHLGVFDRQDPGSADRTAQSQRVNSADVAQPPVKAQEPVVSPIKVLGVIGETTPLENPIQEPPPPIDSRADSSAGDSVDAHRKRKRVESAARGVDNITKELAAKRKLIEERLRALYGIVPSPRDVVPHRSEWRRPCQMFEAEDARTAPVVKGQEVHHSTRISNADIAIRNTLTNLKHDYAVEKSLLERLEKAKVSLAEVMK